LFHNAWLIKNFGLYLIELKLSYINEMHIGGHHVSFDTGARFIKWMNEIKMIEV